MKLVIVDYGVGNRTSVRHAFERLGVSSILSDDPSEIASADALVLPGVGSAGPAQAALSERGLDQLIVSLKQPVLGICLGMQLLADYLEEDDAMGLGILAGRVEHLSRWNGGTARNTSGGHLRVPHMGWAPLQPAAPESFADPLLNGLSDGATVYFAHSYALHDARSALALTRHGDFLFPSVVRKGNFLGLSISPGEEQRGWSENSGEFLEHIKNYESMSGVGKYTVLEPALSACQLIPALDILEGRAVRLLQGDFKRVTDYGDPANWSQRWWEAGARRLHVVDLAGARDGKLTVLPLLRTWAEQGWELQLGGGIRSMESIKQVLEGGIARVVLGTAAVSSPEFFARCLERFGPEHLVAGLDLRDGVPQVAGWLERGSLSLEELLNAWRASGVRWILSTAVLRDGTMQGPDLEQYALLKTLFPEARWIASGGIRHNDDLVQLGQMGIPFAVAGRSLLEGSINALEAWR